MIGSTKRRLAIFALAALLAACDSAEPEPSLKGTWTGPTTIEGVTTNWTLEITDAAADELVGAIAFQDVGTPFSYNAELTGGSYSHPAVTFTFEVELGGDTPDIDFQYQGSANADRDEITGNLVATIEGERMSAPLNFTRKDEL